MKYKVKFPHTSTVEYLGILFVDGEGVVEQDVAELMMAIHTITVTPLAEEVEPQEVPKPKKSKKKGE